MTDKWIIIDGKTIGYPCYINRPLYRYDKACLVQSQAFTGQQTEEKPILRCDEIKNCPIKENYKQLKRKEQECEELERLIAKQKNAKIQLSKLKDKQYKEFCDMKQTLIEIKEIADKDFRHTAWEEYAKQLKQIIQKISECEVENAR